jgi:UPF0755 protein
MKRRLSRNFRYFTYFLETLIAAGVIVAVYNFFLPLGPKERTLYFHSPATASVLQTLRTNGYNITDIDHLLLPKHTLSKKGWYRIVNKHHGRLSFFRELGAHPAQTMDVTLFAGETTEEMLKRLANDTKLEREKLEEEMKKHSRVGEGKLFAGRYRIARSADAKAVIDYLFMHTEHMLARFKILFHRPELDANSTNRLRIVASIIERETKDPYEMPLIASVIYNRLKKHMKLQMDGTLNYGKYSHCIVTPERIKNDTSPYNTYRCKGLPPAPLCNISLEAFYAAVFPQQTDYLFFMLSQNGKHIFSETYSEHLAALKAFREYQKASDTTRKQNKIKITKKSKNTSKKL